MSLGGLMHNPECRLGVLFSCHHPCKEEGGGEEEESEQPGSEHT